MTLEIKVLAWDKHNNTPGLNREMGTPTLRFGQLYLHRHITFELKPYLCYMRLFKIIWRVNRCPTTKCLYGGLFILYKQKCTIKNFAKEKISTHSIESINILVSFT